jgi:hypothetical protein
MNNNNNIKIIFSFLTLILLMVFVVTFVSGLGAVDAKKGGNKPIKTQCDDGQDNDGDGFCDFSGCTVGKGKNRVFLPADSDCQSELDDNESSECVPSQGNACSVGIGQCQNIGLVQCDGSCSAVAGNPSPEMCDGLDNNCDGTVDESLVQQCGSSDVGMCQFGTSTCSAGNWGTCVGNIEPATEMCDGLDNNCDGTIDEEDICVMPEPDLVIDNIFVNVSDSGNNVSIFLEVVVKNIGNADAGSSLTFVEKTFISEAYFFTPPLAAGASTSIYDSYSCTAAHNITAIADSLDAVSESNELNNWKTEWVTC